MYIPILSCFLALKVLHSRSNWTLSCGCLSVKKTSVGQVPPNLAGKKKLVPILKLVREKTGTRSDFHNCNWNWTQFFSKREMDPEPSFWLCLCLEPELESSYMFLRAKVTRTNWRLTDKLVPVSSGTCY